LYSCVQIQIHSKKKRSGGTVGRRRQTKPAKCQQTTPPESPLSPKRTLADHLLHFTTFQIQKSKSKRMRQLVVGSRRQMEQSY
jgi:hypothetical protein